PDRVLPRAFHGSAPAGRAGGPPASPPEHDRGAEPHRQGTSDVLDPHPRQPAPGSVLLMAITLQRMRPGDERVFDRIGPDVFDEPIVPERLGAYLRTPGHLMVLALADGLVVGQCAAVLHRHPDKPTELYLDEVGTASTHLRRGIATLLLTEMFAWRRELGCAE